MTQEQLVAEVRGRLGDPPAATLPDPQIVRSIAAALREFSRYSAEVFEHRLDLSAGRTDYALPIGTTDVVSLSVQDPLRLPLAHEFLGVLQYEAPNTDPWQRMYERGWAEREVRVMEPQMISMGDEETPPVVRIRPEPSRAFVAVLELERPRTLGDMSTSDIEALLLYIMGDCLEFIGRKRSKSITQIPTATGTLKLDDGSRFRREGFFLKREFEKRMGASASAVTQG
jgi:hypothetical protein